MDVNNDGNVATVDLVDISIDEDDDVQFIGHGTKRKVIEIDLNEDLILGVVEGAVPEERVKKLKENE